MWVRMCSRSEESPSGRTKLNALTQLEQIALGKNLHSVTNCPKCSGFFRCRHVLVHLGAMQWGGDHRLPTYDLLACWCGFFDRLEELLNWREEFVLQWFLNRNKPNRLSTRLNSQCLHFQRTVLWNSRAVRPKKAWSATRDSIGQRALVLQKNSARSTSIKLALGLLS